MPSGIDPKTKSSPQKGKAWEELYGLEKALEMRTNYNNLMKGRESPKKGRTYEEFFGVRRAVEIKEKQRKAPLDTLGIYELCTLTGLKNDLLRGVMKRHHLPFHLKRTSTGKNNILYFTDEDIGKWQEFMKLWPEIKRIEKVTQNNNYRALRKKRYWSSPQGPKEHLWETIICLNCGKKKKVPKLYKLKYCSAQCYHKSRTGIPTWNKDLTKETDERLRKKAEKQTGWHHTEEAIEEMRSVGKKNWEDPKYVRRQMKSRGVYPNKPEIEVDKLLQKILPNEYKYVGDGEFTLAGKCPDFVNINGQKKLIELNGDYWHSQERTGRSKIEEEQQRIDHFKKFGWDTLIVWENELEDREKIKEKVFQFNMLSDK